MIKVATADSGRFLKKFYITIITIYILLITSFYYCSGDQLFYRESRSPIQLQHATSGTVELYEGQRVNQVFMTAVERIDTISVQWGTFYRPNAGTVHITLYAEETEEVLMQDDFNVAEIGEGGLTTLKADKPIENMLGVPLVLEITSDSPVGQAASPLMADGGNNNLFINGEAKEGILCFSVDGTDYIKSSHLYWPMVIGVGILLIIICGTSLYLNRKNRPDKITLLILSFYKYRFLFKQLIRRDFKAKYKRSVLGMLWSVLNPVFMMGIQYFVFSTIFKSNVPYYGVYLLIGIIVFNFFSEACNASLVSIVINSGLINKVYVPKYLYPITKIVTALINFSLSLIPLCIAMIISGMTINIKVVLVIIPVICLILFATGLGLALSSAMVFFRDTQFLWSLFSLAWMYSTPIFYTEDIIPQTFRGVFAINPLYHMLKIIRSCLLYGVSTDPIEYIYCLTAAVAMLIIGSAIFKCTQDKFILNL